MSVFKIVIGPEVNHEASEVNNNEFLILTSFGTNTDIVSYLDFGMYILQNGMSVIMVKKTCLYIMSSA
jgi:hypothetical protein